MGGNYYCFLEQGLAHFVAAAGSLGTSGGNSSCQTAARAKWAWAGTGQPCLGPIRVMYRLSGHGLELVNHIWVPYGLCVGSGFERQTQDTNETDTTNNTDTIYKQYNEESESERERE